MKSSIALVALLTASAQAFTPNIDTEYPSAANLYADPYEDAADIIFEDTESNEYYSNETETPTPVNDDYMITDVAPETQTMPCDDLEPAPHTTPCEDEEPAPHTTPCEDAAPAPHTTPCGEKESTAYEVAYVTTEIDATVYETTTEATPVYETAAETEAPVYETEGGLETYPPEEQPTDIYSGSATNSATAALSFLILAFLS